MGIENVRFSSLYEFNTKPAPAHFTKNNHSFFIKKYLLNNVAILISFLSNAHIHSVNALKPFLNSLSERQFWIESPCGGFL